MSGFFYLGSREQNCPGTELTLLMPLPSRYQPPNLAISTLYWKAWPLLLVVAAFNPENIGKVSWPWEIDHGPEPSKVPASIHVRPEKML